MAKRPKQTRQKKAHSDVQKNPTMKVDKVAFDTLLSELMMRFINLDIEKFDSEMDDVTKALGSFVGADRCYIFVMQDDDTLNFEYEWHDQNVKSNKQYWQNMHLSEFPWWLAQLRDHGFVHVPRVEDMPKEATKEQKQFMKHAIESLIAVPLLYENQCIGFLGFSTLQKELHWDESAIMLLKVAAEIIANALHKRDSQKRLEELDDLRNRFIRVVSHQIRTPLTGVRWNLETLLDDGLGHLSDSQEAFVRATHVGTIEVIHRLSDMLTALDIEQGNIRLDTEKTDVAGLLTSVMIDVRRRAKIQEVHIAIEPTQDRYESLQIDPIKMKDVLLKLAENAIDYTPKGGEVTLSMQRMPDSLRLKIKDTGIGIPTEEQRHIFERFYRATNATPLRTDAPGVSLSIVKYYVEQHGGTVSFESKQGEGSVFWVDLPLAG